jgi:ADP-heptose:LPS heptosyltransferase
VKIITCDDTAREEPIVVFITYSGLGDLLMALPLFSALRPHFKVLPVIQAAYEEVARLLCKDTLLEGYILVKDNLRFRRNPWGYVRICRDLSRLRPDVVLIYGKQILALAAYSGLLVAGRKLFCAPGKSARLAGPSFETLTSTGNRTLDYMQFAERLGVVTRPPSVAFSPELRGEILQTFRPSFGFSSYSVVAPWSSDPRRDAPLRFFRECIEMITGEGQLPVVVTGSPRHRPDAERLVKGLDHTLVKNLVGATSLGEMLGLLAGARFLLTNDSGNLHLARLVKTLSLVAFGPTISAQLFVDENRNGIVPLGLGLSCSPCAFTPKYFKCRDSYLRCLQGLTGSHVKDQLQKACQSTSGGPHD